MNLHPTRWPHRLFSLLILLALLTSLCLISPAQATSFDLAGPPGSVRFGENVVVLPNGNLVVIDTQFNNRIGAIHFYNGTTLQRISTFTGTIPGDEVGSGGVTVLPSGDFVVASPYWTDCAGIVTWCSKETGCSDPNRSVYGGTKSGSGGCSGGDLVGDSKILVLPNGNYLIPTPHFTRWDGLVSYMAAGAVTFCPANGCPSTQVRPDNSLTGSAKNDWIGSYDIVLLANGGYVVTSPWWDNGVIEDAGAVTGCPASGCIGQVTSGNSLVGSSANDNLGINSSITVLDASHYLVRSNTWDNGSALDAGSLTFCQVGTCTGPVSAANSRVGGSSGDGTGLGLPVRLAGGGYAAAFTQWDHGSSADAGAVVVCPAGGCAGGLISAANSLVGTTSGDHIGDGGIVPLKDGGYTVGAPNWDKDGIADAGAAIYCPASGCTGPVTAAESLTGSSTGDNVGVQIVALSGGGYVVSSNSWNLNAEKPHVGASTACPSSGCRGMVVSPANSLTGDLPNDRIGGSATALPGGGYVVLSFVWHSFSGAVTACPASGCVGAVSASNSLVGVLNNPDMFASTPSVEVFGNGYLVISLDWDNGPVQNAGALTLCPASGCTGEISAANSLIGSSTNDYVGGNLTRLANGNLVVTSLNWNNAGAARAGAITFCKPGTCTGVVSPGNSLVGSTSEDAIGTVVPLANGGYLVASTRWDNSGLADAGAVTLCPASGCTGPISATNSLVGSSAGDGVGQVTALADGYYAVKSPSWSHGSTPNAGAVTLCPAAGCKGPVTPENSVLGSNGVAGQASAILFKVDYVHSRLVVGRPADNLVSFLAIPPLAKVYAPLVKR